MQCKWAALQDDIVAVPMRTCRMTAAGYVRTVYSAAEIDGVAAYCADLDRCFWLPMPEFAEQRLVHLRLRTARNNQTRRVKCAAEYPFGAIAQLGERVTGSHEVAGSSPASSTADEVAA